MKTIKTTLLLLLVTTFAINSNSYCQEHNKKENKAHWGYSGEHGPDNWGKMKPEYKLCENGISQSPIDFNSPISASLIKINFNYKPTNLNIINNGHTIQVNYTNGSFAVIDGKKYSLLQFHFHTPSEHTVSGMHFDMEMHLVHKNKEGKLAVVGVFIKVGKEDKNFDSIIANIPEHKTEAKQYDEKIDVNSLLPKNKSYFHYFGFLTTPPCTEGVSWSVLTTPIEISRQQYQKFHSIIGNNNRPVQPINNRFVLISK